MNHVAEEMKAILNGENDLMHYGTKFHSGRYPYGSGEDPYQHDGDFLSRVERLKKDGWKENAENVKKEFGMTLEEYRNEKAWANYTRREMQVSRAQKLLDKGLSQSAAAKEMGINESTLRSLLNPDRIARMNEAKKTADSLKELLKEKGGMIDVGANVELDLNVSRTRLDQALYALESEGYHVYPGRVPQPTNPGKFTTQLVLCNPDIPYSDIYNYPEKIQTVKDYISRDGGITYEKKFNYPESMDSKRLMINYAEDGGIDKDGIIEIRRGVPDLSLGESHYSQVRILVDKNSYLKGMAVYADDLPDGVDVRFNTNKTKGTPMEKVLKPITNDPDNPFGALIKDADKGGQYWYDPKTGERVSSKTKDAKLGLINKKSDEGDWTEWQDSLPSQFLSKQSKSLAQKQLNLAKADKMAEFDDICTINNATIKKHYLREFADKCDKAAVDLKAAALPGQKYHVIIPVNTLKDTEVYAPQYTPGTKLALIRYPHGGTFEIPILTVNNKNQLANKIIGKQSIDAIGINKKIADRLSGADFDGDTVMCIPTHDKYGKVKITNRDPFDDLIGFDPKLEYSTEGKTGVKLLSKSATQKEMGTISNLITDMTLAGAPPEELTRAVKHSMVVIDAAKHKLDYKRSEIDNGIAALHNAYQGHYDEKGKWHNKGAATIISRAKGQDSTYKQQGSPKIDPETGKQTYKITSDLYYPDRKNNSDGTVAIKTTNGKKITYNPKNEADKDYYTPVKRVDKDTNEVTYTNKDGSIVYKTKIKTQRTTKMAKTDDAYTLVSDFKHPMELVYADYANSMKSLANRARKELVSIKEPDINKTAAKTYANEVASLNSKLNEALKNSVRERQAIRKANASVADKIKKDPNMEKKDIKKANQQAITKARQELGTLSRKERSINITDREWEAIQAGAVNKTTLRKIINNADVDDLRQRATPKTTNTLSPARISKARHMANSNYTLEQIAEACGCSPSTVSKYLKGAN